MYSKKYLLYGYGKTNRSVAEFLKQENVIFDIYCDNMNDSIDIGKYDIIIKSPGIKPNTKLVLEAIERQIPVISDLELFYKLFNHNKMILVTGTNGKTTTANYIYQLLKDKQKVYLLGNIGTPLFDVTKEEVFLDAYLIIETSSFTLDNTYSVNPFQLIITSLAKHHLEYHLSFENYVYAKIKLVNNLNNNAYLITEEFLKKYLGIIETKYNVITPEKTGIINVNSSILYKGKELFKFENNKMTQHDLNNLKLALCSVSQIIDLKNYEFKIDNLNKFSYRFEKLPFSNYLIYNDAKSTNIASTISAINSLNNNILLILGGKIQEDDYELLLNLKDKIRTVYLYGENKELLYSLYKDKLSCLVFNTLKEVIDSIEVCIDYPILYSPAAPSFDQFENYLARGKLFNSLINQKIATL